MSMAPSWVGKVEKTTFFYVNLKDVAILFWFFSQVGDLEQEAYIPGETPPLVSGRPKRNLRLTEA
jgi:hypothetical protein